MRAEELDLAISRIAGAALRAGAVDDKLRVLTRQLLELEIDDQAVLMQSIGSRAIEDPACSQLLLLMLDVNAFRLGLGADRLDRLRQALGRRADTVSLERASRTLASVDAGRLPLLRAKTGVMLQALSMLNDRLEAKRSPLLKQNGYELAERVVTEWGLEDARIGLETSELPQAAAAAVRDILLEVDFEEVEDGRFETRVTDEQIRVLGQAAGLSRALGAGVPAALSESVVQRQALQIIKRFCLLCRSTTMYPPDHPSLPPAFDGFRSMIEQTLEGRDQITLTVLSGDVLLDDVKIRKEDPFKKTLADLFDERQVSSVTFRPGLTVEEVKAFLYCFTDSPKLVKDRGGVRAILTRKNVCNVLVDQFRYRVVADDGTPLADDYPGVPGDRLLESLIYSHMLERIERGGNIQSLSVEEAGAFFKEILTDPNEDKRRALARLLITLDPDLLEQGFLSNPELRRSLSWAAARKALDVGFRELAEGDHEAKERGLDTIAQLADLAISRHKETTVTLVLRRLVEYVAIQESDPDLLQRAALACAAIGTAYLRRRRLDRVTQIVSVFSQLAAGKDEISLGQGEGAPIRLGPERRALVQAIGCEGLNAVGRETEAVEFLIQALADPDPVRHQPAIQLLETLATDVVVTRMFRLFLDQDRGIRSRAYRLLKKLGPTALALVRHEVEERRVPTHPGRDPGSGVFQNDGEWYILRNALSLLAEIDPGQAGPLLAELAADPDPRARRESLWLLAKHSLPRASEMLRCALGDARAEVRETALRGLGVVRDEDAVDSLIDVVFRRPDHRLLALDALGDIGAIRGVDFLLTCLDTVEARGRRRRRKRGRIMPDFPADRDAILGALQALGAIGGAEVESRLEQFIANWSSPLRGFTFRPGRRALAPQDFLPAAENALALSRRRRVRREGGPDTGTARAGSGHKLATG